MMRWLQRGVLATALALLVAGLAVSCDSGGMEPNPTTTINADVMADGSGVANVDVELYASGGVSSLRSATTNGQGRAVFGDLDAGTYDVEITVPAGYDIAGGADDRQSVTVSEGQSRNVTFNLESNSSVVEVHLTSGLAFSQADITIEPGTTVRWVNDASIFHTITPDGHTEWSRATVNTAGDEFTHTFNTEGDFPYYCEPHLSQGMTGTVTVQASP
jgi:plastocyanin